MHGVQQAETMRTRKEIYCENCGSNQPMIEHEPQKDELPGSRSREKGSASRWTRS